MTMCAGGPLVSIVTPLLNSSRFVEQTIRSVLEQEYAAIEYVVMDGGSADGSLEILRRYEGRLRYVSEPDAGQADAINRGFALTSGQILAFLNADDAYLPGAVATAVRAFSERPDAGVVYGDALYVDERGTEVGAYPVESFDRDRLARRCFICQPAAFFRRDVFVDSGGLDTSLRFALDYDFWIRVSRRYPIAKIDGRLATLRLHDRAKTVRETEKAMHETIAVLQRHYGYVPFNWLYGYGHHRLTRQSVVREAPRPALTSACYSLVLGARYNWRHPLRYCHDVVSTTWHRLA